jgi:hypothetical protein
MKSGFRRLIFAVAVLSMMLLVPAPSFATQISGVLSIGGSSAEVGATFLNFLCNSTISASCPSGYGNFLVSAPVSGSFTPYSGDNGFIHSLSQASQPANTPFSLANFLIFNPAGTVLPPDIALDLTFIFLGTQGQAQCLVGPVAGQNCTPALPTLITATNPMGLSPFNLQNTQTGSTASFSLAGNARRISTGEISAFSGVFTAQFTVPYQTYLPTIASGGSVTNSYSATFNATTIPEPQTTALVLGGLLVLLGRVGMRRYNRGRLS